MSILYLAHSNDDVKEKKDFLRLNEHFPLPSIIDKVGLVQREKYGDTAKKRRLIVDENNVRYIPSD